MPPSPRETEIDATIARWIDGLRHGDPASAEGLWQRYFERLIDFADRRLAPNLQPVYDREDAALSAFHSLCRGVRAGRFPELSREGELWSLLVVITARKVYTRARAEQAAKRGGGGVHALGGDGAAIEAIVGAEPSPEFAAEVADQAEHLLSLLNEGLRNVALRKIEGLSNEDVAAELGCAVRTVERRLALIRRAWSEDGMQGDAHERTSGVDDAAE